MDRNQRGVVLVQVVWILAGLFVVAAAGWHMLSQVRTSNTQFTTRATTSTNTPEATLPKGAGLALRCCRLKWLTGSAGERPEGRRCPAGRGRTRRPKVGNKFRNKTVPNTVKNRSTVRKEMQEKPTA